MTKEVNVFSLIRSQYLNLIPSEKRIADYVLEHPKESVYLSNDQLAEVCHVSKATVTRFCRSVGYSNYKEYKYSLVRSTARDDTDLFEKIAEKDSAEDVLQKVSAANCAAIRSSKDILDIPSLETAVQMIFSADRILLFANGGSSVIALDFYHKFLRLGINCCFSFDSRMQMMSSHVLKSNDLAIGFTFSGANEDVVNCMQTAAKKGVKTIGFTCTLDSPITKVSDVVLCASNSVRSKITGSIEPRIALLNVVDSLFLLSTLRNPDQAAGSLAETLEVLENSRLKD